MRHTLGLKEQSRSGRNDAQKIGHGHTTPQAPIRNVTIEIKVCLWRMSFPHPLLFSALSLCLNSTASISPHSTTQWPPNASSPIPLCLSDSWSAVPPSLPNHLGWGVKKFCIIVQPYSTILRMIPDFSVFCRWFFRYPHSPTTGPKLRIQPLHRLSTCASS